jgi:CDP-glucose 4,6-dehydratase
MLDRSFWKGRKVFVTGHTGFKGGWLCLWLDSLGANVVGYALEPPTNHSLFEQAKIAGVTPTIYADVRNFSHLKSALAEHRPEIVLHMAAQSVVRQGYDDPIETYSSNVMGTVNLLQAIRELKQPCVVVNVTSDKCYANREVVWGYREEEPMGGHDPYSNSKGCSELVTSAFRDSFFPPSNFANHGVALGSARAGNAIGGGDWTRDQLIPDLFRAFLAGKSCLIRNPSAIRPWQFVLEPLRGYLALAERLAADGPRYSSGWNFGPVDADAKQVSWIADKLVKSWGSTASWTHDGSVHPPEAHFLKLDASKAGAYLSWYPALRLSQALEWIAKWYCDFKSGADVQTATRNQIQQYEELLANQEA